MFISKFQITAIRQIVCYSTVFRIVSSSNVAQFFFHYWTIFAFFHFWHVLFCCPPPPPPLTGTCHALSLCSSRRPAEDTGQPTPLGTNTADRRPTAAAAREECCAVPPPTVSPSIHGALHRNLLDNCISLSIPRQISTPSQATTQIGITLLIVILEQSLDLTQHAQRLCPRNTLTD